LTILKFSLLSTHHVNKIQENKRALEQSTTTCLEQYQTQLPQANLRFLNLATFMLF
jgi:hypothetical protein